MNEVLRRSTPGLLLLLLCACTAHPIHFYTLVESRSDAAMQVPGRTDVAFMLDPVSVPRSADIPQLVIGLQGGALKLAEDRRWIAPLPQEIRASLSQLLAARLGMADVSRLPTPASTLVYRIRVDVQRFESLPGGEILVSALWSIRGGAGAGATTPCATRSLEPAGADYDALVAAYRRSMATLAARIAEGVLALHQNPQGFGCPLVGLAAD